MNLKAWELRENETLLGSADASYIKMSMGMIVSNLVRNFDSEKSHISIMLR